MIKAKKVRVRMFIRDYMNVRRSLMKGLIVPNLHRRIFHISTFRGKSLTVIVKTRSD